MFSSLIHSCFCLLSSEGADGRPAESCELSGLVLCTQLHRLSALSITREFLFFWKDVEGLVCHLCG